MAKLPAFDLWKSPWSKSGEDFDADRAAKFIYDLSVKVETREAEGKAERAKTTAAEEAGVELQTKLDAKVSGADGALQTVTAELAAANKKLDGITTAESARRSLALDVALDIDGITAKQARSLARRLSGNTKDELEADAEATIEELGLTIGTAVVDDGEGEDNDRNGGDGLRRQGKPRTKGDPDPDAANRAGLPSKITLESLNELVPF